MAVLLFCVLFVGLCAACDNNTSCSLNGVCSGGICKCDAPWYGASCGLLARAPARPGGIYGYTTNVTSWGGNVISHDGTWHLYVAEMEGKDCGLHVWGGQSAVVHATSKTLEGPYMKQKVVVKHEAHNPQALSVNGSIYIFHIGGGDSTNTIQDCNESAPFSAERMQNNVVHRSSTPEGPFEAIMPKNYPNCNNPSPFLAPNGTLFLACTWSIHSAPTPEGPWGDPIQVPVPKAADCHWEDPFLWIDKRNNFHLLSHAWSALPYPSNAISAHAFSEDGVNWNFSEVEPYNNSVVRQDGTVDRFATLERPKLVFGDPSQPHTPTHIINGVSPVWGDGDDPCAPCGKGKTAHCSHCKQQPGIDWTYTLMQPLAL